MLIENRELDKTAIQFDEVMQFLKPGQEVSIAPNAMEDIRRCREYLDNKLKESDTLYYGVNTGFGFLQNVRINETELQQLQQNLLLSHACGIGEQVPHDIVKLMLLFKIKSLVHGHSGVSVALVERLAGMFNNNILPVIYTQGSLGASGDLAPLSHLSLPLIGKGKVYYKGIEQPSEVVNDLLGWQPLQLQSKEGLALVNGTQFMSAYGIYNLIYAERLIRCANTIAAISFDAFNCVSDCLHPLIHAIRAHKGQVDTATLIRSLLEGSEIALIKKDHVQDPYSFRCIPQVHGATLDTYTYVLSIMMREVNSVTDNPSIFPDEDMILNGGNFHGQPLALALDFLAIAMSELANISERRTFQLLSGSRGLPLFLVKNPGLHSGLMIPQYTAAGIVSENKQLCTPASVDSISSSNNQEDHVSMGANAATKCLRVLQNVEKVLAIELLTAVQALEFRRPLRSSNQIEKVCTAFREKVSFNDADRFLHEDMVTAIAFLQDGI